MIALDQSNSVAGEGSLFTFPHTCAGQNLVMLVVVCYIPDQNQEVVGVTYGGVPMTKYGETRIRNDVVEEFWYGVGLPEGLADVSVGLTASAETTCASASFTGVDQADPIYFRINGAGDMVEAIPLTVQAQNGDMLFGFGACSGTSESPVMPWQTSVWNRLQSSAIRSQGICSFPNFTAQVVVDNTIDPASRWACDIIGVRAA
jgi:hypothetical protein